MAKKTKVADFLPIPVEVIVYDDDNDQPPYYRIIGCRYTHNKLSGILKVKKFKASDLYGCKWARNKWGVKASIYSHADKLIDIMAKIVDYTAVIKTVYNHTGWLQIDNKWCYLHGGGVIGTNANIDVDLPGNLTRYRLPDTVGDKDARGDAIHNLFAIADKHIILPIIALVFLTPLNQLLLNAGCEPTFVLYYVGLTQSRKSTLAALMLSFFGKFDRTKLPANFRDTINALEPKCGALDDTLLVVDDYHPSSTSDRRKMDNNMQTISRMYGDRCAKDRMGSNTSLRAGNIPHGNVVVTGEDIADVGQSGLARNLIIDVPSGSIPVSDALNATQAYAADGTLAAIMRDYIEWLLPQTDGLEKRLKKYFEDLRRWADKDGISGKGRTGEIAAWLMIGVRMLIYYLIDCQIYDINLSDSWQILADIAVMQKKYSDDTTPTEMFMTAANELLGSGKIHTDNINMTSTNDHARGKMVGYHDSDNYYFLPGVIYAQVNGYYTTQRITFPLACQRLLKILADSNISITNDGRNTYQKRIGNTRIRCLCIPRHYIDGITDGQDDIATA